MCISEVGITSIFSVDHRLGCFAYFKLFMVDVAESHIKRQEGGVYLNALIWWLRKGAEKALIQWKVVILYLLQPSSHSTLNTSHMQSKQSLWMLNLLLQDFLPWIWRSGNFFFFIARPLKPDKDLWYLVKTDCYQFLKLISIWTHR